MHYYVDGYNLLFRSSSGVTELRKQRDMIISELVDQVVLLQLDITLVFDSSRIGESTRGHFGPLEVVYTALGDSADTYIIDELQSLRERCQETVVTSDKTLAEHARRLGAKAMSIESFLLWIRARSRNKRRKKAPILRDLPTRSAAIQKAVPLPPRTQEEAYLLIFEQRLEEIAKSEAAEVKSLENPKSRSRTKKPALRHKPQARKEEPESDKERWQRIFEAAEEKRDSLENDDTEN